MTLADTLQRVSNREFLIWRDYFRRQLSQPSRTDYYLMQIAAMIAKVNAKNPKGITLEDFKLRFGKPRKLDRKKASEIAKAVWKARLGLKDDGERS